MSDDFQSPFDRHAGMGLSNPPRNANAIIEKVRKQYELKLRLLHENARKRVAENIRLTLEEVLTNNRDTIESLPPATRQEFMTTMDSWARRALKQQLHEIDSIFGQ